MQPRGRLGMVRGMATHRAALLPVAAFLLSCGGPLDTPPPADGATDAPAPIVGRLKTQRGTHDLDVRVLEGRIDGHAPDAMNAWAGTDDFGVAPEGGPIPGVLR